MPLEIGASDIVIGRNKPSAGTAGEVTGMGAGKIDFSFAPGLRWQHPHDVRDALGIEAVAVEP